MIKLLLKRDVIRNVLILNSPFVLKPDLEFAHTHLDIIVLKDSCFLLIAFENIICNLIETWCRMFYLCTHCKPLKIEVIKTAGVTGPE